MDSEPMSKSRVKRIRVQKGLPMDSELGLHKKYDVRRNGQRVDECFVLRPETDQAALSALVAYATYTSNRELAADLWEWIYRINGVGGS